MMTNAQLRTAVKELKLFSGVSYKLIAAAIGLSANSFYCWLRGNYDFGSQRQRSLTDAIKTLNRKSITHYKYE